MTEDISATIAAGQEELKEKRTQSEGSTQQSESSFWWP